MPQTCSRCQHTLSLRDEFAGACPSCGERLRGPSAHSSDETGGEPLQAPNVVRSIRKKASSGRSYGGGNRGKVIFWLCVLGIGLCVGSFFLIRYFVRKAELSEFTKRVPEYTAAASPAPPNTRPYIKDKVIPVDTEDNSIDWIYYDLPGDLRAETPADVGTVVLLRWGKDKVGEYGSGGGGAYVRTCSVAVIDHEKRQIVAQAQFRGGDPPRSAKRGTSAHGSYPTDKIVDFLKSLPQT